MNNNLSGLELLPNEILIDIFQYFDAQDLFRAFNNLSITFSTSDPNEINESHITIITLDYEVNIDLSKFTNIRCLRLSQPTCEQLDILDSINLPYLEYLSLGSTYDCCRYSHPRYRHSFCDKIFSNDFPNLISCYLLHSERLSILSCATQLLQLSV